MHTRSPHRPRGHVLPIAVPALVVAAFLTAATAASAAPAEPTLGVTGLQAMLEASGTVPGYFKTVVDGSRIDTVPVTIRRIIANANLGGPEPLGHLIFFEATGPIMQASGGIAAGMSGSPVFVGQAGVDKLVGAVSYGDAFTLNNLGLATPIEDMAALEDVYDLKPMSIRLPVPVKSAAGSIQRLVIAQSRAAASAPAAGTAVLAPMRVIHLGGLSPKSRAYADMATALGKTGVTVVPGMASGGAGSSFETTLEGGAAIGSLISRGDLVAGGFGTVTYATPDTVVAYGHPAFFSGTSGMHLTNAFVEGLWGSALIPYKLASAGKVRGIFTQDRSAGIAGRTDKLPEESMMTARARMVQEGVSANATSWATRWALDDPAFADLPVFASAVAVQRAINAYSIPGSALTTSTYVVTDGTATHTVTRVGLVDSEADVSYYAVADMRVLANSVKNVNAAGLHKLRVASTDFSASLSTTRLAGEVADVAVPGGLKTGANVVRVAVVAHGVRDTQTVSVPLVLPAGTKLTGELSADGGKDLLDEAGYSSVADRRTPADAMAAVAKLPAPNHIVVTYRPMSSSDSWSGLQSPSAAQDRVETSTATPWSIEDGIAKPNGRLSLSRTTQVVGYGKSTVVTGVLSSAAGDTTITLFRRSAPATIDSTLALVPVTSDAYGEASFNHPTSGLRTNTRFTAVWEGDEANLGATASVLVKVRARVTLSPSSRVTAPRRSVRLTARLTPNQRGSRVVFTVLRGGRRVMSSTRRVGSTSIATTTFRPTATGTYTVSARFLGSSTNSASTSNVVRIVVR